MKIALAQLNYHIGNFDENSSKIIHSINQAKEEKADLIIFAELAVGGYPAKDLLKNDRFIQQCEQSIKHIQTHCKGITCILGAPIRNLDQEGKPLFNAAVVIQDEKVIFTHKKALLPDYDVFDEYRYFEPGRHYQCITINKKKIALTVCEDLWDDDDTNSYVGNFMEQLRLENPELIINIAASPFSYIHYNNRVEVLRRNVIKTNCPLIYVNQVGAHADIIFDGRSLVMDKKGDVVCRLKAFEEDFSSIQIDEIATYLPENVPSEKSEIGLIHDALILGLKDYFRKSGFSKAVLGLSGGLDSALVAALACEALGSENVLAILMPSKFSSGHSLKDALDLVGNTGCSHHIIPIQDIAESFDHTLGEVFNGLPQDLTEENIQARIRGTLLMAISNKKGHILLNTSNKSEAAVGYGTLYGDMAGALAVIGDVYKTQAYELARYINRDREIIPINTITKAPSAELRPDQKDSDSLPEYDLLDSILYQLIEIGKPASELIQLGFEESVIVRVANLLNRAEFKRFQAPPILRVSPKAFGAGRLMPLVANYPF